MSVERDIAFEADGIILNDGAAIFSGDATPSFDAEEGDRYLKTDKTEYVYKNSSWQRLKDIADMSAKRVLAEDLIIEDERTLLISHDLDTAGFCIEIGEDAYLEVS